MIRVFTKFSIDLKTRGFNPGYHVMYNEASIALKKKMTIINIKYQLVTPGNHRYDNINISIKIFKNYFTAHFSVCMQTSALNYGTG